MEDFTSQQLATYKKQYAIFDDDGDGKISVTELQVLMETLGVVASTTDIEMSIKRVNKDEGCKSISFADFIFLMKAQKKKEEMLKAFERFDVNGDGYITAEELRQVMREAGDSLDDEQVDSMITLADTDGDGKVNYEEFVATLGQYY